MAYKFNPFTGTFNEVNSEDVQQVTISDGGYMDGHDITFIKNGHQVTLAFSQVDFDTSAGATDFAALFTYPSGMIPRFVDNAPAFGSVVYDGTQQLWGIISLQPDGIRIYPTVAGGVFPDSPDCSIYPVFLTYTVD